MSDMFLVPPPLRGRVKRRKARRLKLPTDQHWAGTVGHTTINGLGKIARLRKGK